MLSLVRPLPCCELIGILLIGTGCAHTLPAQERAFVFGSDTFAFANELVWEYGYDAEGRWRGRPRTPRPDYSNHCFFVARAARQFFEHARFDPQLPPADDLTYRRLVRQVLDSSPRKSSPPAERVTIPGYENLREFSAAYGSLLKRESGGAWRSYVQRGHWRMIFPFSRNSQERMAGDLVQSVNANRPAILHVVSFPSLSINHAVLVFAAQEYPGCVAYTVYDPNSPDEPAELIYDRTARTFYFPANDYFQGGSVDGYEVYRTFWN